MLLLLLLFNRYPGLPVVGNTGFSLELTADGPAAPGWVLFSFGSRWSSPMQVPQYNLVVWIDELLLAGDMTVIPVPAGGNTVPVPLPIPANPILSGVKLFAQSFHFFGTGIDASPGLKLVVQ